MAEDHNATVRVLLFGALSEQLEGRELEAPLRASPLELWRSLPGTAALPLDGLRVARNRNFCHWDTALQAGDEVAFMPPVTGG